jgi:hypothetical protein
MPTPLPVCFRVPAPRSRHAAVVMLRRLWTLPTNVMGHAAGLLLTGRRPVAVGGPAAQAWLYVLAEGGRFGAVRWLGGVALGHAILLSDRLLQGEAGRLVLAHELAHTRQHDWLGPLYLPLHILCQLVSSILSLARPQRDSTPFHAYNPLEQTFLAVGHQALRAPPDAATTAAILRAFGV